MGLFDKLKPNLGRGSGGLRAVIPASKAKRSTSSSSQAESIHGVDWLPLDGIGSLQDQANKLAKTGRYKAYSIVQSPSNSVEPVAGFMKVGLGGLGSRNLYPAAALLAQSVSERAALYIGRNPQGAGFVLTGLLQGMPSPSYDKVGNADDIAAAAQDYSTFLAGGAALYVQNGIDENTVPQLAGFLSANRAATSMVVDMPGTELLNNPSQEIRYVSAFQKAGAKAATKLLWGILAAGLLGCIAYLGWSFYNEKLETEARRKNQLVLDTQAYLSARDNAFKSKSTFVASQLGPVVWRHVKDDRISRASWLLSKVECKQLSCEWIYNKKRDATFKGMISAITPAEQTPDMKLTQLETSSFVEGIKANPEPTRLSLDNLVTVDEKELTVELGTIAQTMMRAGLGVNFSALEALGGEGTANKVQGDAAKAKRKVGTWTMKGPTVTFADAMKRLPGNVTLDDAIFKLSNEGDTFEATGRYFTK